MDVPSLFAARFPIGMSTESRGLSRLPSSSALQGGPSGRRTSTSLAGMSLADALKAGKQEADTARASMTSVSPPPGGSPLQGIITARVPSGQSGANPGALLLVQLQTANIGAPQAPSQGEAPAPGPPPACSLEAADERIPSTSVNCAHARDQHRSQVDTRWASARGSAAAPSHWQGCAGAPITGRGPMPACGTNRTTAWTHYPYVAAPRRAACPSPAGVRPVLPCIHT